MIWPSSLPFQFTPTFCAASRKLDLKFRPAASCPSEELCTRTSAAPLAHLHQIRSFLSFPYHDGRNSRERYESSGSNKELPHRSRHHTCERPIATPFHNGVAVVAALVRPALQSPRARKSHRRCFCESPAYRSLR